MLINFPKFLLFLILFLGTKFANSTDDKNFIEKCKEISAELKFRIQVNSTPPKLPIQPGSSPTNEIMTYREHPLIASGEEFDEFIAGEIKFLAVKLSKIGQRIKNKETSFDRDVKIFVNHFRKEIKNDEIHHIIWNTMLKKDLGEFFDTLNQFLWKIDDKNLKKIEKNGKVLIEYTEKFPPIVKSVSGANHSTGNALVSIEYIAARKMINEFIKVLKMEIVYGQGIAAIIEIKEIHDKIAKTFKEKFEEIQKGKNKIQLTKFITGEKKDPRKYNDLYLYNLLNYAIIELHKILVEFVADTVDGKENKILKIRSIVLTEQFVKPMLRKVFDETMTMPGTQETRKFMKPIASSYKIIENEPSSSSSRNRKKGNDTEAINVKFEYDLVKKMEMDLGLTTNFFKIEQFILNEKVSTEHGMVVSKSKIRIAAAKLILAYERLKAIYSGKIELNDDEKKEAKEMEDKLSKDYVYETNANK